MTLREIARRVRREFKLIKTRLSEPSRPTFECPVCGYKGPFLDRVRVFATRKHAMCPKCSALERHRVQFLVLQQVLPKIDLAKARMLHFAPEPFFEKLFRSKFANYESADLNQPGVDHHVDIQNLPFAEATYDFVFASHVLEHIPDDRKALAEIHRILKPGGIAILPVPIACEKTVEYPQANPKESYHMRAPGMDYFDRYRGIFSRVEVVSSKDLPEKHQPWVYEDRTKFPSEDCPLRPPMAGDRHPEPVPICYA